LRLDEISKTHVFTQDVDPPEDEAVTWTEEQLRDYYSSCGEIRPERRDTSVAGGFRDLPPPPPTCFPENMPKIGEDLTERLLTVEAYREAAFANGIPFRPNGLFTMGDSLLAELSKDPGLRAFQKNVVGFDEDGEPKYVVCDSFAHGDGGAANGVDLRCFYRPDTKTAVAAFRLGHRAAIAHHMYTTAHGGSIETVLDETTAEVVKCATTPAVATTEMKVYLKRPLELFKTYRVDVEITDATEFKTFTKATIRDPSNPNMPLAIGEAVLAHSAVLAKLMGKKRTSFNTAV